jgi:hypothetical protein
MREMQCQNPLAPQQTPKPEADGRDCATHAGMAPWSDCPKSLHDSGAGSTHRATTGPPTQQRQAMRRIRDESSDKQRERREQELGGA